VLRALRIVLVYIILAIEGRSGETPNRPFLFSKVYVVFAEEHSLEFVSGFGHCFICLAPEGATTAADLLLAPSLNFGVDTSPLGNGIFIGRYTIQPTFELVRKNTFFQQRRLIFFELNLSTDKIAELHESLAGRIKGNYEYDFYRRNCGYYLADWLYGGMGCSDNDLPGVATYLTPRAAVNKIIKRFGVSGGWVINSPGLLAEERLATLPQSERQWLKPLHSDLESIQQCQDMQLRLLYLQMLESHANPKTYPEINAEHVRLISTEPGKSVQQNLTKLETVDFKDPSTLWPNNNEGPSFAGRLVANLRSNSSGIGLSWESGLRDFHTDPKPPSLLRQVHFLSIESDIFSDQIKTTFKLFEIDTIRDINDLFGVGSSGASVLFEERINSLGARGVCAKAWSGLGVNIDRLGWACIRLHIIADEIGNSGRFRAVPEIFFYSHTRCPFSLCLSAHPQNEFGYKAQIAFPLGVDSSQNFVIGVERAPSGDSRAEVGYSQRY